MRLVLDTNVVLSGLLWGGPPSQLVEFVALGRATSWTSVILLDELADVLGRRKLIGTLAKTGHPAAHWIETFEDLSTLVSPAPLKRIAPDPDDDWVIATAVAAQADLIVTGDKPLLSVGKVGDTRIVSVADALRELTSS